MARAVTNSISDVLVVVKQSEIGHEIKIISLTPDLTFCNSIYKCDICCVIAAVAAVAAAVTFIQDC